MILELENPIPVITPKGKASVKFLIDRGVENDLEWVCVQDDTCECWSWRNPDIRFQKNITQGREYVSPFYDPEDVKLPSAECKRCCKSTHMREDSYSDSRGIVWKKFSCLECGQFFNQIFFIESAIK